jgi:hypothetical protein
VSLTCSQSYAALNDQTESVRALLQLLECHRCVCKLSLNDDSKRRVRGRSAKTNEGKDQWLARLDLLAQLVHGLNQGTRLAADRCLTPVRATPR